MSAARTGPPDSVPTLTEVVTWPQEAKVAEPAAVEPQVARGIEPEPTREPEPTPRVAASVAAPAPPTESDADVAQRLLVQIQQQLDLALDVRLREALTPVLARAADALVRDARREMTAALRDIVARAVDAELAKRPRP